MDTTAKAQRIFRKGQRHTHSFLRDGVGKYAVWTYQESVDPLAVDDFWLHRIFDSQEEAETEADRLREPMVPHLRQGRVIVQQIQ